MSTPTKKQYVEYLNDLGQSLSEEEFIMGGKQRIGRYLQNHDKYGTLLRKHDPIAFEVGYREYVLNKTHKP